VLTPVPVDVLGYRIVVLGTLNSGIGRAWPFHTGRPRTLELSRSTRFSSLANSAKTVRGLPVELLVLTVLLRSKAKLHSFWIESKSWSVLPNCPYCFPFRLRYFVPARESTLPIVCVKSLVVALVGSLQSLEAVASIT
jgi:hypothetical protein